MADYLHEDLMRDGQLHSSDLEEHVVAITLYSRLLDRAQRARLVKVLGVPQAQARTASGAGNPYGADFDLAQEVGEQIKAVRAVRQQVMTADGSVAEGMTPRDMKEVVTSGTTLLGSLMKFHKEVINMDRLRKLEQAVIDVLMEEDEDLKNRVLAKLEERLGA
jgi:ABC-type amino acid transport substrate-binding protein